ncbi:cytochrome bd-I oxidase subunit CydX [Paracoccus sp. p4-l81]
MWYFAWMLGLPLAAAFAIVNAMWLELVDDNVLFDSPPADPPPADPR